VIIIMISAGGIFWNFLIGPALLEQEGSWLAILVNSAYPFGDLLLALGITLIIFLPLSSMWMKPLHLLLLGHGLSAIVDSIFVYQVVNETYASSEAINILFSIGPLVLMLSGLSQAAAAQQAALGQKTLPLPSTEAKLVVIRLVTPFAWLLFAFLLLDFGAASKQALTPTQFSVWLGVIIVLIAARQAASTLDNRRLAGKLRAMNDELEERVEARTVELVQINSNLRREMEERRRVEMMLREREERLTHFGLHDALTGLPNRALLLDRLSHAIQRHRRRPNDPYAILFLDFDSFKVVNDSLGHPSGDQLLAQIGTRLTSLVRAEDTVARLGGDEFVILIQGFQDRGFVTIVADRVLESLKEPFLVGAKPIYITASIGVVIADPGYASAPEIIRDADLAMYEAKTRGKGRFVVFMPNLRVEAINRQVLDSDMRRAMKQDEFLLHYQPIISLNSGKLHGLEALIRWQHPLRGLMNPSDFIPIAESNGFIDSITCWTIQEACRQLNQWQSRLEGRGSLCVSINLSPISLRHPNLLKWVEDALESSRLPPGALMLEIVESAFIQEPDLAGRTLNELRRLGVSVSLDDFGIGYSSLGYINQYPIDIIKIDRSFVNRVTKAGEVDAVVRVITALARELSYKVIAEGIETRAQLNFMKETGCQYGQGFYFAPPLEACEVPAWLFEGQEPGLLAAGFPASAGSKR
jgi:diguanylate cyclase (GGDEF)-like protein